MHVMAISSVPNIASFWNSLKAAHGQLPRGANWVIAATTDYLEADAANAVGLPAG